jgi:hypothetical protein
MILIHTGWEVRGERAGVDRGGYDTGWELVLAEFEKAI